jgi:hypothetical protein
MEYQLLAEAHLADLRRLAEHCNRANATRRALRQDAKPGWLPRLAEQLVGGFAATVPPAGYNPDPWYPWWWEY